MTGCQAVGTIPPGLRSGDPTGEGTLFDLAQDPGEQHDVSARRPDVIERLRKRHDDFIKTLSP